MIGHKSVVSKSRFTALRNPNTSPISVSLKRKHKFIRQHSNERQDKQKPMQYQCIEKCHKV